MNQLICQAMCELISCFCFFCLSFYIIFLSPRILKRPRDTSEDWQKNKYMSLWCAENYMRCHEAVEKYLFRLNQIRSYHLANSRARFSSVFRWIRSVDQDTRTIAMTMQHTFIWESAKKYVYGRTASALSCCSTEFFPRCGSKITASTHHWVREEESLVLWKKKMTGRRKISICTTL